MNNTNPVQVVAVTSGKGGVGKTTVAINLGISLARLGQKVAILDGDLGLPNVDTLLGLQPQKNLQNLLLGDCRLTDIIVEGPEGVLVIPGCSGNLQIQGLNHTEHAGMIYAMSDLGNEIDILLVDTATGLADSTLSFACAAQETLVVVCDEPSSIRDAYALIGLLSSRYQQQRFRVIANMTRGNREARDLFDKLKRLADRFLDVTLQYAGFIPFDDTLQRSLQRQRAVVEMAPRSKASKAFKKLAEAAILWPVSISPAGHLEFFVEQRIARGANHA